MRVKKLLITFDKKSSHRAKASVKAQSINWNFCCCVVQRRCQPKIFRREQIFWLLSEQQYFVWDSASQSTKWQDMLEIWWEWPPWPPGYAPMAQLLPFQTRSWEAKLGETWRNSINASGQERLFRLRRHKTWLTFEPLPIVVKNLTETKTDPNFSCNFWRFEA